MDEKQRRNLGAHYTSEKNILKLIKPLFLDNLWQESKAMYSNPTWKRQMQIPPFMVRKLYLQEF